MVYDSFNNKIMPVRPESANVKKHRPVNLALQTISFPATAIVSILHRVSGVINFFAIGILLWMLHQSLMSPSSFEDLQLVFAHPLMKFIAWGMLTALSYHLWAGLRHLVMDKGFWEDLESGLNSAKAVFILAIFSSIIAGCWIW